MHHLRLKTKPLAKAAKRSEEMITLENMIFGRSREVYGEKTATRPEGLENERRGRVAQRLRKHLHGDPPTYIPNALWQGSASARAHSIAHHNVWCVVMRMKHHHVMINLRQVNRDDFLYRRRRGQRPAV